MDEVIRNIKRFLGKINGKNRYIFFIAIFLICAISISIGIYVEYYTEHKSSKSISNFINKENEKTIEEYSNLKSNFNNLYKNEIKSDDSISVKKSNYNKDIVYTGFKIKNEDESYYYVDAKIPTINIENSKITEINDQIRSDFYEKANSIMRQNEEYIVYNVSYIAYINNNILSLAIKASLKEGEKVERIIIKTYNIDLEKNEEISFENLLSRKNIDITKAQKKIKSEIKSAANNAKALENEFEGIYQRDTKSEIYNIKNAENYFITNEGDIYLIYSYGNTEETNEIDIIIF